MFSSFKVNLFFIFIVVFSRAFSYSFSVFQIIFSGMVFGILFAIRVFSLCVSFTVARITEGNKIFNNIMKVIAVYMMGRKPLPRGLNIFCGRNPTIYTFIIISFKYYSFKVTEMLSVVKRTSVTWFAKTQPFVFFYFSTIQTFPKLLASIHNRMFFPIIRFAVGHSAVPAFVGVSYVATVGTMKIHCINNIISLEGLQPLMKVSE